MYLNIPYENLIFFDCETVPLYEKLQDAPDEFVKIIERRFETTKRLANLEIKTVDEFFDDIAGLYPEYNKIVAVGVGFSYKKKDYYKYIDGDEKNIVTKFLKLLYTIENKKKNNLHYLCGHNIVQFDIPLMVKKSVRYGIKPLPILSKYDEKAWDKRVVDTKKLWSTNVYNNLGDNTLAALCYTLGIDTPKSEGDGSNVREWYYSGNTKKIEYYMEKEIKALRDIIKYYSKLKDVSQIH